MKRAAVAILAVAMVLGLALGASAEEKKGPPKVNGTVKAVDAAKLKITLAGRAGGEGGAAADTTYTVDQVAKVLIDGQAKALNDLKLGGPVTLTLSDDKLKVVEIVQQGPRKKEGQ